jgi:hypothetical protein
MVSIESSGGGKFWKSEDVKDSLKRGSKPE